MVQSTPPQKSQSEKSSPRFKSLIRKLERVWSSVDSYVRSGCDLLVNSKTGPLSSMAKMVSELWKKGPHVSKTPSTSSKEVNKNQN